MLRCVLYLRKKRHKVNGFYPKWLRNTYHFPRRTYLIRRRVKDLDGMKSP